MPSSPSIVRDRLFTITIVFALALVGFAPAQDSRPPNVLFIAMDDLNDWIGCLGGHPQTITPNMDRLAAEGALFTNAHCPASACNPSRTAILCGISPHRSGIYANNQPMRRILPDATLLPQHFRDNGYWAGGSGKMLHYFTDARSWDTYFPPKNSENPIPRTLYPDTRPLTLPVGGPWQYVETDWGPLDATDEEFGGDWLVSNWVGEQLSKEHDQPFFLACGIYRPHEPWFVPKKYFEPFPLDSIQLPPRYKEDDLDDLPPAGKWWGPNRYFDHIREHGQWKQGIQGYLASIHFADAMLGRVLDALESGPNKDNTIVILWSDHGWRLGSKQHWQKYTAWRAVTRVPLMVRVPKGAAPGLPQGTRAGAVIDQPVSLQSLYRTTSELAGLAVDEAIDGPSLIPLLKDADAEWKHPALTFLHRPGALGVSLREWRYIHYANGDEELYFIPDDPHEWNNLAALPEHAERLAEYPTAAGILSMTWKDANFADPIYTHQLSEGTLRFLWLASLLQSPELSTVIMIDEPEVSLHPELLSLLVELLREASRRTHIMVATHSDRLIRFLEPSEVLVMDLDESGLTTATWADSMDIEHWLADYSLDEVWAMGRMGGRS